MEVLYSAVLQRALQALNGKPFSDPLNVFIKREPHSRKKLDEGRYRLISGVSMIDTMLDRIIFDFVKRASETTDTPVRIGFSLIAGGWRELTRRFKPHDVLCIDKSSWDWTMQQWVVESLTAVLVELADLEPDWVKQLIQIRMRELFERAVFGFRDGTVARQRGVGIMKSGCFMTIILNSIAQLLLHAAACEQIGEDPDETCPDALGDDTIQRCPADISAYTTALEDLGCIVKEATTGVVEFAGFQFSADRVIPKYYKKHLFALGWNDNLKEWLEAMQYLYVFSPSISRVFRTAAIRCGAPVVNEYDAVRLWSD